MKELLADRTFAVEEETVEIKSVLEARASVVEAIIEFISNLLEATKAFTFRFRATIASAKLWTEEVVVRPACKLAVLEANVPISAVSLLKDSFIQATFLEQISPVILILP